MKKRMFVTVTVLLAFFASIGFVKFKQIQAAIAQNSSFQMPPEAVTTIVATESQWQATLPAIGSVTAVRGVEISADLPGIVEEIAFESGDAVAKGALLVRQDTRQEQAQLAAAQARLELAKLRFDRASGLVQTGAVSRAEFDAASADVRQQEANIREVQAAIDRKTIRAPFSGVLGIRKVDLGQYLNSGTPIVPLQSLDPIYVDFAVPQNELGHVRVGGSVRILADGIPAAGLDSKIAAINSVVDTATRNVQVRSVLPNPKATLRPGMFVKAQVVLDQPSTVVAIPASSISYAPYGDSVYVVEDMKGPDGKSYKGARQQIVKLGAAQGDLVAIATGISAGQEIVTSGVFKLRNGAAVQVHNETQPASDIDPKPEDN